MTAKSSESYAEQERRLVELMRRPRNQILPILGQESEVIPGSWVSYAEGELYRTTGDWVLATSRFEEGLERDPESPLLGAAYAFLVLEAEPRLAALERLCTDWPSLERPHFYLALAFAQDRQYAKALAEYQVCTKLMPEDAQAWAGLAAAHIALGQRSEGYQAAVRLAELTESSVEFGRLAARAMYQARHRREAFRLARGAVRSSRNPRDALVPWTLPILSASGKAAITFGSAIAAIVVLGGFVSLLSDVSGLVVFAITLVLPALLAAWLWSGLYAADARRKLALRKRFVQWRDKRRMDEESTTSNITG